MTSVNAQVSISNGANIFLSSGATFATDMGVTLNGNAVIENNGAFEAASMSLNNSSTFTNNTGASFDLSNTLKLNNTSQFANNTGATSLVADSTIISSTLANTADFGSRYFDILNGGTLQNGGALQIQNALIASAVATFVTNTGALEFVGNDNNKRLNTDAIGPNLSVRKMTFDAGDSTNIINLESVVLVSDTADFNSGRVRYANSTTDSLVILGGALVTADTVGGGGDGIMTDVLYRYPGAPGARVFFPVGDLSGKFRPFWIDSAVYPGAAPKIGVEYLGNRNVSSTNALGYNSVFNQNSWGLGVLSDSLSPSIVEAQFAGAEASLTESVVAEGFNLNGADTLFYNLGNGGITSIASGGRVQSLLPAQGNSVLVIGQSTEVKLRVTAILEGAVTGALMTNDLFNSGQLVSKQFIAGQPASVNRNKMVKNQIVPDEGAVVAVDSIMLILIDNINPAPANFIDTARAWLMTDGTIRDFLTGTQNYAIFDNAQIGTNYYVILSHRNHLKVRGSSIVNFSNNVTPEFIDLTDPTEIYGGGGIRIIAPSTAVIVGGNSNEDMVVNAFDYNQVGQSQNASDTGYRNTNILFNSSSDASDVNVNDFTRVQTNSNILYFSTAE